MHSTAQRMARPRFGEWPVLPRPRSGGHQRAERAFCCCSACCSGCAELCEGSVEWLRAWAVSCRLYHREIVRPDCGGGDADHTSTAWGALRLVKHKSSSGTDCKLA